MAIRAKADKRRQNHGYATCRTMALWATNELHLTTMPGELIISRVLSLDTKSFDSSCDGRVVKKTRNRTGKHHAVEEALHKWICDMHNKRTNINAMFINQKYVN